MAYIICFVLLLIILRFVYLKQDDYIPFYNNGWGTDFGDKLNLSNNEKRVVNFICAKKPYDSLHTHDFYKELLIFLFISSCREIEPVKRKRKRYPELFYYCDLALKQKFHCNLSSFKASKIVYLESVLAKSEKDVITDICNRKIAGLNWEHEKLLFMADSSRWEYFYELLTVNYSTGEQFRKDVTELGDILSTVVSKRNLYHKAYRFVADKDRTVSLKLYIMYLSIESESESFRHLNISKANQKILFKTKEQKNIFENIVNTFKKERDLQKALSDIDEMFIRKRKEIRLDRTAIKSAKDDLKDVVNLLNEYLENDDTGDIGLEESESDEQINDFGLNAIQSDLIRFFVENSYISDRIEVDKFAKEKGIFAEQVINDINESYYDSLDDFLIEENGNSYILNHHYYQKIKKL